MDKLPSFSKKWLEDFAKAVRHQNLAQGKKLFADHVVSFGTVCFRAEGIHSLAERQWQEVWSKTRDFDFEYETSQAYVVDAQAVILTTWTSSTLPTNDNDSHLRRGRATIVLRRAEINKWEAIHTHFSLGPMSAHDSVFCLR